MHLITLGRLRLQGASFSRPKPLLLATYLALEGAKGRRFLGELFWPDAARPLASLRVALSQLRQGAPDVLIEDGDLVSVRLSSDASTLLQDLEAKRHGEVVESYGGAFLDGVDTAIAGNEFEEWVFATREFLGERVRNAIILLAEQDARLRDFRGAGARAQEALAVAGAPPPEPVDLERLHRLLVAAGSDEARRLEREALEYGLVLEISRHEAQVQLAGNETGEQRIPNNLPAPVTLYVGRDPERIDLARLLDDRDVRVITIVGPGGVGKSRLALESARSLLQGSRFDAGIYLVQLESLNHPPLVPATIAAACGFNLPEADDPLGSLVEAVGEKHMLLILDNCEHLSGVGEVVLRLITACPNLTVLATSRELLQVRGEHRFPLEGLAVGAAGSDPRSADDEFDSSLLDAVQLFVQRGRAASPRFEPDGEQLEHVVEICRLVQGMPLGIELAAGWLRLMPPRLIAQEMARNPDFLVTEELGVPKRHSSLRATFEYSWGLLSEEERLALMRLSPFRGGFTPSAAAAVADADFAMLARLADRSLILADGGVRFQRHPLIWQYSREKLEEAGGEAWKARLAHARWLSELAREANATEPVNQAEWLDRLEREHENFRAALEWSLADAASGESAEGRRERLALGLELTTLLYRFWYYRSHFREGRYWLRLALHRSDQLDPAPVESRSLALHGAGVLSEELGEADEARSYFEERLLLAQELNDLRGQAASLNSLGVIAWSQDDYDRAREFIERSIDLRMKAGATKFLAGPHVNLGLILLAQHDLDGAVQLFERALGLAREQGDQILAADALVNLAVTHLDREEAAAARDLFEEALVLYREMGSRDGMAHCLLGFAGVASLQGRHVEAARLAGSAASLRDAVGITAEKLGRDERHLALARSALGMGAYEAAVRDGYERGFEEALSELLPT